MGWNPYRAYTHAFEGLGSDFNVAIKDDASLSPDSDGDYHGPN